MNDLQIGRMQGEVETLKTDVAELKRDVKTLLELANKSKGGIWAGMSIAAMLGSLISWIATHVPFIKS